MNTLSSRAKALNVLNPPQKPVIKNNLYAEQESFFSTKYVKTIVAKKQPQKFATNVPKGR